MVKVFYFNLMKYIVFILFLLCAFRVNAQWIPKDPNKVAQLNIDKTQYPNARTVDCSNGASAPYNYTSTNNNYTSAIFSNNPRIENGFFLVDIYFLRGGVKDPNDFDSPVNEIWENLAVQNCDGDEIFGVIGSFSINFTCSDNTGLTNGLLDIFEVQGSTFEINPLFTAGSCKSAVQQGSFTIAPQGIGFAYDEVPITARDKKRYGVRLEANTPLFAGVVKLKLKANPKAETTRLVWLGSSFNVATFGDSEARSAAYVAGGWLDGKDINIPLTEGPKAPEAPTINPPATNALCLAKNNGEVKYTYSIKEADKVSNLTWMVSTPNSTTPVSSTFASWTPASKSQSTTVTWKKAGTYWVNAYVEVDGVKSDYSHVEITIKDRPQAVLSYDKTSYKPTDGRIVATVSDGSSLTGTKNYGWIKPTAVSASTGATTYTQSSIAAGNSYEFQAYVRAANGCSDTTDVETKIVGDNPKLMVEVEELYALCAGGVGELQVKRVTTEGGTEVSLSSCTFAWKNAGGTTVATTANYTVTAAGTYSVTVKSGDAEGTVSKTVIQSSTNAPVLADRDFYVKTVEARPVIWTQAGNGVAASDLSWNWSPASQLDDATREKPKVTSLASGTNTFGVYAVDKATTCRSANASVRVLVNSSTGLDVTIDPGDAVTLCVDNKRYLTAKVNGVMGTTLTGYTYEWTPTTYLTAVSGSNLTGPQVVFNATNAGTYEVFVTATSGSYSSTQKITVTVNPEKAPRINDLTANNFLACTGSFLEVEVIPAVQSGEHYTYAWTNGGTATGGNSSTYTFATDGEYDMALKVTAPNGCEADTVMWPHMSIRTAPTDLALSLSGNNGTGGTVLCGDDGTLTLTYSGAKPETIRWFRNGLEVTSASGRTTLAVTSADAGSTYMVTASNGVCEASTGNFTFTKTQMPSSLTIDVVESCGELALVSNPADPLLGYTWSANGLTVIGGTTSSTARFSGTVGTYTVSLTAKNGNQCQMTATKSVELKQKPNLAWAANNPTNQCEGDVLRVTSDMTIKSYVWKNGSVTATSTTNAYTLPLNGGAIMAIGTAENGCADTVSGSFAGHSKPVLAWKEGMEPSSTYYAGEKIEAAVRATKGDGSFHYYYTSPYTLDNTTGDGKSDYLAAINETNDFFVMVADGHGCRDTLQKAIAVEGQSLIVTIENKHDAFACAKGSAILTAKVQHGVGELQYQWYRNGSPIAGATDSVYIVNFPSSNVISEVYRVEVTCPLTTGTGNATKQWTSSPGTAPQLTVLADVITILPNEVAVLGANAFSPVSNSYYWHWTNSEKLAAGEDTKQYPHTVPLRSSSTQYQVYVIDDRNCMSNIGDVEVRVNPTNGLRVAVVPESAVLCRNNSVELTATANRSIDACEWYTSALSTEGVTLEKNNAKAVFKTENNTTPKDYQQVVKVTSGGYSALALNTVTVRSDRAPKLPVMDDGCGGASLYVLVDDVPDDGFVWYVDGTLVDDNHSFMQEFDNSDHAVKVVMKSSDNTCWSDTLRVNVWQMPEITGDMIADKTTVTKNDRAKLEVPLSDATTAYSDMTGSWSTTPTGYVGSASGTHNRLMTTSALQENNTNVTYTISNSHNAECKASKSLNLTVFDPATGFDISLDKKVFANCEGDPVAVQITPINADGVPVNYELTGTKDGEWFETLKMSRTGVIGEWTTEIKDLEAGEYQLFIAATETKNSSIARDTVTFTVHPNPTVTVGTLASTDLCTGSGDSLRVVLTFANGAPWKLEYRDGGVAQAAVTGIMSTDYSLYLKKKGVFSVMKVENTYGCTASALPAAVTVNDITPTVEVDRDGFVSFCQGGDKAIVRMNLKGGTPDWKIYYTLDGGAQQTVLANTSSYGLELTEGGVLKVDSVVNAEGCRAAITSGALFDGVEVEDDRLQVEFLTPDPEAICASDGVGATIALRITPEPTAWPLQVNCLIHLEEGGDRQLNVEIRATDKDKNGNYVLRDIVHRGEYVLRTIMDGNTCRGSIGADSTKVMSVGTLPEVNIDSTDFVAFKGQEFVLNAVDKQDDFTYSWSLNDAPAEEDNGGIRAVMEDEDMVYRLIARDAGGCVAEDTVTVYRLPDAPSVNIAKVDGENTLKIHWEHDGRKTNGFKLWHNEWDAYAIESAYTETDQSFAATATPEAVLNITDQDTLEFFYVVAFREIDLKDGQGKRRFNSLPSDTLGYHQHFVSYEVAASNYISYMFDMSDVMGGNMASQFLTKVAGGVEKAPILYYYDFPSQSWAYCFEMLPGEWAGDFEIEPGKSYLIDVLETYSFLEYGKLPTKISYELVVGESGNRVGILLPLQYINLKSTGDVVDYLGNKVMVNYWDYNTQSYGTTFYLDGVDMMGSIPIRVLTPLLIEPTNDTVIWK